MNHQLVQVANQLTQQTLEALPGLWWKFLYCANHEQAGEWLDSPLSTAYLERFNEILHTPLAELSRDAEENGAAELLDAISPEKLVRGSVGRHSLPHFNFVYTSVRGILRKREAEVAVLGTLNGTTRSFLLTPIQ